MDKILQFVEKYNKGIGASRLTRQKTLSLARRLIREDPFGKLKFEVSFKISGNRILNQARLLNMDADSYSCKSPIFFLDRLEIYRSIMKSRIKNRYLPDITKAIACISKTPMNLYFGADIDGGNFIFAFWIIFGGIKRSGEASFWNYDFEEITGNTLEKAGFKPPLFLKNNILNLGFDIGKRDIFYKLYYLLDDRERDLPGFTGIIRKISGKLENFKYFSYFSKMYDKQGECRKEKLFVEFLEDIYPDDARAQGLLAKVLEIGNSSFSPCKLSEINKMTGARISLISFETNGTLTFYLRPE